MTVFNGTSKTRLSRCVLTKCTIRCLSGVCTINTNLFIPKNNKQAGHFCSKEGVLKSRRVGVKPELDYFTLHIESPKHSLKCMKLLFNAFSAFWH